MDIEFPACPKCGGTMKVRVNKKKNTKFLGCSRYPQCDGTQKYNPQQHIDPEKRLREIGSNRGQKSRKSRKARKNFIRGAEQRYLHPGEPGERSISNTTSALVERLKGGEHFPEGQEYIDPRESAVPNGKLVRTAPFVPPDPGSLSFYED